tara:strand:+ start:561 stop:1103 length:543 start_codon:yes stop_codon:yes gene_type:complete
MDSYTKYLMFVGLFIVVVTIVLFFVMYNYSDSVSEWPPKSNTCPDYWTKQITPDGIVCYDTLRMTPNDDIGAVFNPLVLEDDDDTTTSEWGGIPLNGDPITFTSSTSLNDKGRSNAAYLRSDVDDEEINFGNAGQWSTHCGKRKWAMENGVTWDGITNSNIDCSSYLGASTGAVDIFSSP